MQTATSRIGTGREAAYDLVADGLVDITLPTSAGTQDTVPYQIVTIPVPN